MTLRRLTYELKRPVPLALLAIAAVAVLIALLASWQHAEERHDLRRQARLLMMAETTARHELDQIRQSVGTLAALIARSTAQQQELSRFESARAQAQQQLAQAQQDLQAQQAARSELAKLTEADAQRAGELRTLREAMNSSLNTLREESAGLERRVADFKRELEETQGRLDEARLEEARAQEQRGRARHETTGAGSTPVAATPMQAVESVAHDSLRSSKLKGVPVIGLDHINLGEVEDVLVAQDQPAFIVIRIGGVLGIGGKLVALPFEQVVWNPVDMSRASASVGFTQALRPSPNSGDRMPGTQINTDVLRATEEGQGGRVTAETGPVVTGTSEQATAPVGGNRGRPERAMVRMTKADLDRAPGFQYRVGE